MTTLRDLIEAHTSLILQSWADEAKKGAAARGLSVAELVSLMPAYLGSLARSQGDFATGEQLKLIETHLSSRLRAGFNLDEMLEEFALLSRIIVRVWSELPAEQRPDAGAMDRLFAEIQAALGTVTRAFYQHLIQDEQTEKRHLRGLGDSFAEPLDGGGPLSPARLRRGLLLIHEAMRADATALVLHEPESCGPVASVAVGLLQEASAWQGPLGPGSLAEAVRQSEWLAVVSDVETTKLAVSDELRRSGLHPLLGLRLGLHREFLGLLYVGLSQRRPFSAREMRRMEALGERLSFYLANARLHADLRKQVEALQAERSLREQFVSVVAHDLRGPLASATMAARMLAASPGAEAPAPPSADGSFRPEKKIAIILRNLSRADRMTTDLLDVHRVHAGKRLELQLEEADLGAIARQVIDDLREQHGERFLLRAEPGVRGIWGVSVLQRALWNLLSNAIKYGAEGAPITVAVAAWHGGAEVSVHNQGNPIAPERQASLFEPFTRGAAVRGAKGWGLGLTLVRACAEAHGGGVEVHSTAERGTTFTLRLPTDARLAQQPGRTT